MLKEIHILSPQPDDVTDANGQEVVVDKAFIKEIYDSYDPSIHEAPVIIGHDSDSLDEMPDWIPAYGWIKELRLKDGSLYALAEISEKLGSWLKDKFYKKVSAALYQKDSNINPVKGKHYLRHLAFLGASPPAIKGLEQFQFSEENKLLNISTVEFTENEMPYSKKKKVKKEEESVEMAEKDIEMGDCGDKKKKNKPMMLAEEDREMEEETSEMTEGKMLSDEEVEEVPDEKEPELTEDEKTVELAGDMEGDMEFQEEDEEEEAEISGEMEGEEGEEGDIPDTLNSPEEAEAFLNENFEDLLASIISEGDKGYKGEITRFEPVPSADNTWLYDEDSETFQGRFIDDSLGEPEIYDFTISKEEDGSYTKSFRIVDEEETELGEPYEMMEKEMSKFGEDYEMMEEDPEFMEKDIEMGGYGYDLKTENMKLKQMLAKMSAKMHHMKMLENEKYVNNLFAEGKITPAMASEADIVTFLNSLNNEPSKDIKFSEGAGEKVSQLSFVMGLLDKLPQQIQFGEMPMSANDSKPIYESPIGTMPDPEGEIIHQKVTSYINEKGLGTDSKSYLNAYKQIMKNEGVI